MLRHSAITASVTKADMARLSALAIVRLTCLLGVALLVFSIILSQQARAAPASYRFAAQWGGYGIADGHFRDPFDIAVDQRGHVFVVDEGIHLRDRPRPRVEVFDTNGRFLWQWGNYGTRPGQFRAPEHIAIDQHGDVYVTDDGRGPRGRGCLCRVQKFTAHGRLLAAWGAQAAGRRGFRPWELAVSGNDVYVVDGIAGTRVERFSSRGRLLSTLSVPGGAWQLDADRAGNVYATVWDMERNRVVKLDRSGNVLAGWGGPIELAPDGQPVAGGAGRFTIAWAIAVGPQGTVYVSDVADPPDRTRVELFDATGAFLGEFGQRGTAPGQLLLPRALAVDGAGAVYVVNIGRSRRQPFNRIEKFSPA